MHFMTRTRVLLFALVLAIAVPVCVGNARADEAKTAAVIPAPALPDKSKDKRLPAALLKPNPENVDDLKAIEDQVKEILPKVLACTVCLRATGSGSGVIISADGLILTAGHVSGEPGRDITIIMPDGKTHKGKTLGGNGTIDSGLVRITEKGKWPYVEMGKSSDMKKGDWCLTTGHPGGFRPGRSPVIRVGRILEINDATEAKYIRTDCTLVGGDSGGPLFDMHGRVIGIHSRIGGSITANLDVPVDTYRETWDRLVKGERWGRGIGRPVRPTQGDPEFGFKLDASGKTCQVSEIAKDSPAEKAGLKIGDVIKKFDGKEAATAVVLLDAVKNKKPGDEVTFEIQRGKETLTLKVTAGRKLGT
jgi:serine protease Do